MATSNADICHYKWCGHARSSHTQHTLRSGKVQDWCSRCAHAVSAVNAGKGREPEHEFYEDPKVKGLEDLLRI